MSKDSSNQSSAPTVEDLLERWLLPILMGWSVLIIFITIYPPLDLNLKADISLAKVIDGFDKTFLRYDNIIDFPRNILLFLPLGFSLSGLLYKRKTFASILIIVNVGFGFSLVIELLQFLHPFRKSSFSDILANGAGMFLGFVFFRLWGIKFLLKLHTLITKTKMHRLKILIASYAIYTISLLLIPIYLQKNANLSNWNLEFPIILGNELTGDRSWQGTMFELHIANNAITEDKVRKLFAWEKPSTIFGNSLVSSFDMTGDNKFSDTSGHLPDLLWQASTVEKQDKIGVNLTSEQWLIIEGADAKALNEKLVETSQFTIVTTVAPANLTQGGPARIISISKDSIYRNITIGQQETNLIIRLRTPITGEGGIRPFLVVPKVFTDTSPHRLIITYAPALLKIYVDRLDQLYTIPLTSEYTFLHNTFGTQYWKLDLENANRVTYSILYYGIVFSPFGFLLSLVSTAFKMIPLSTKKILGGVILLPVVSHEIVMIAGRGLRPQYMLLSLTIIVLSGILFYRLKTFIFGNSKNLAHRRI